MFAGMFKSRVEGDVEKSVKEILSHLKTTLENKTPEVEKHLTELKAQL
jgi:actin-like ATPase involved in cell morphogenesis